LIPPTGPLPSTLRAPNIQINLPKPPTLPPQQWFYHIYESRIWISNDIYNHDFLKVDFLRTFFSLLSILFLKIVVFPLLELIYNFFYEAYMFLWDNWLSFLYALEFKWLLFIFEFYIPYSPAQHVESSIYLFFCLYF
jgi:hypothetical protein